MQHSGRILEEGRWARTYSLPSGGKAYASKFLTDGLSISRADLEREWAMWSDAEKLDFAVAYKFKPDFSAEDADILSFLMEKGDDRILVSVAHLLTKYPDREKATRFLADRVRAKSEEPKTNFIVALGKMSGQEAGNALYEFWKTSRSETKSIANSASIIDYLHCCAALQKRESNAEYKMEIEKYLNDSRELIRRTAERLLKPGADKD